MAEGGRIFVPLAREPWEKFRRGSKTVEVRRRDSPVALSVVKALRGTRVTLSLGYGKGHRLEGFLGCVYHADNLAGLGALRRRADLGDSLRLEFFDPEQPVVAFEVLEVRPCQ